MVNAIDAMTTTLTANPDVTHWVFYSCNDDGVLGAARALENAGYAPDQGLGVGIGGNLACEAFANGNPSGFRATLWLNPANHGRDAVSLLINNIQNGTPIPMTTFTSPEYIDAENFESFREKLCG
jgi:L-arabinose transport system substrate-binding protein